MSTCILDSDRTDRYEFEVFVGEMNFAEQKPRASEKDTSYTHNDADESRSKTNLSTSSVTDSNSSPKYTVRIVLDDVLESVVSSYNKTVEEHRRPTDYDDDWKPSDSLVNIVKEIQKRYKVDEKPNRNEQRLCYNVRDDSIPVSMKLTINRGVVCIFNCLPRTLVSLFQTNPLELTIYEDLENDENVKLGTLSVMLSGLTGFTDAIVYHFYEKGYDPYTYMVEKSYEVKQNARGVQPVVVGEISLRLKLTCHGPRSQQELKQVGQIILGRSDRPPLRPVFVDQSSFDFPLDKLIVRPSPKMMYNNFMDTREFKTIVPNREIRELLHCRSVQESLADDTDDSSDRKPCSCPCKDLLERVKILLSDNKFLGGVPPVCKL